MNIPLYKKQATCFEQAVLNKDGVVVGLQHGKCYKYASFPDEVQYSNFILSDHPKARFTNEMLWQHCKTFVDIDTTLTLKELGFDSRKDFISKFDKFIIQQFQNRLGIKVKKKQLLWSDSCRPGKTSFHLVINLEDWYWHNEDRSMLRNFMKAVAQESLYVEGFHTLQNKDGAYHQTSIIDLQVYGKNRLMRSLGCRKEGIKTCLLPVKGTLCQKNIIDHMIGVYETSELQRLKYNSQISSQVKPIDLSIVERIAQRNESRVTEITGGLIKCRNLNKQRCCSLTGKIHDSNHIYMINKREGIYLHCFACPGHQKLVHKWDTSTLFGTYGSYKNILKTYASSPDDVSLELVHRYFKESVVFIDNPNNCYYVVKENCPVNGFQNKLRHPQNIIVQNLFHKNSDVILKLSNQDKKVKFSDELARLCKTRQLPCYNDAQWIPFNSRTTFRPSIDSNVYNLFPGFALENVVCDWKSVNWKETNCFQLLFRNLCNENEESFNYLIHFLAHKLQKPFVKLPICHLWINSKPGTGKSSLQVLLSRLFATNHNENITLSYSNLNTFTGKFNSELKTNLWVSLEEMKDTGKIKYDNFLKDFVSNQNIFIEKKGVDRMYHMNYSTCMMFSNDCFVNKVNELDRRQVFYDCSDTDRNDKKFFDQLYSEFDSLPIMKAIYEFLVALEISEWNYRDIPENRTRDKLQQLSKDVNIRFIEYLLNTEFSYDTTRTLTQEQLYYEWGSFIESQGVQHYRRDQNYVCTMFELFLDINVSKDRDYTINRELMLNKLSQYSNKKSKKDKE